MYSAYWKIFLKFWYEICGILDAFYSDLETIKYLLAVDPDTIEEPGFQERSPLHDFYWNSKFLNCTKMWILLATLPARLRGRRSARPSQVGRGLWRLRRTCETSQNTFEYIGDNWSLRLLYLIFKKFGQNTLPVCLSPNIIDSPRAPANARFENRIYPLYILNQFYL